VEYLEPGLLWELRRKIKGPEPVRGGEWVRSLKLEKVDEFMRGPGPRVCTVPTDLLAQIAIDPAWKIESATGINLAKGKPLALSMIVKPRKPEEALSSVPISPPSQP
jgi:hypothetical protein